MAKKANDKAASSSEAEFDKGKWRAKQALASIGELEVEDVEELALGAETELAKRDAPEVEWKHILEYEPEIRESIKMWGKVGGLSTGLPSLDMVIGGLRKGQLTLIAGESNQGKSALAAQIAVNISREHKVGYISLEMLPGDNGARINHMNGGTEQDIQLEGLDIFFQSTTDFSYKHLDLLLEKGSKIGIEIVMLDYLQFLGRSLTLEEVGLMTKTIKMLTTKYKIPIVVIVSLRKGTQRKWTDIGLDDLMGTSAIGYDADNTFIVSHKDMDDKWDDDHVYLKILKLRNMKKTRDNEFLIYDWFDTKITEPVVPLHLMIQEGDIDAEGKVVVDKPVEDVDN